MDELFGDIKDLSDSLSRLSLLPPDFEGKEKMSKWLKTLSEMEAADNITDAQARQMLFDLESSYNAFTKTLHQSWTTHHLPIFQFDMLIYYFDEYFCLTFLSLKIK